MKGFHKKVIAAVLTASMLLPVVSCKKGRSKDSKSRSGQKISEDSPWFESTVKKYDPGLVFEDPVEYIDNFFLDCNDDTIVIETRGRYKGKQTGPFEAPGRWIEYVTIFDRHTQKVKSQFDLAEGNKKSDQPYGASYANGVITVEYSSFNSSTYELVTYENDIDPETGKILDTREVIESNNGMIYCHTDNFNDYVIKTTVFYVEGHEYCTLDITSPDGSANTIELKEDGTDYGYTYYFYPLSDTKAMVPIQVNGVVAFFELDFTTMKLTKCDEESMSWLDNNSCTIFMQKNRAFYYSNIGIFETDYKNKSVNEIFDYSWCGVNRSLLTDHTWFIIDGDTITLLGETSSNGVFSLSTQFEVYEVELKKADKNPHAGKQMLELYSAGGQTSDVVSDAILEFNETNGKYYIEVTDRYDEDRSYLTGFYKVDEDLERTQFNKHYNIQNEDDRAKIELSNSSELSDRLAVDIINGDGPDILMNVSQYGQLNNSDYLADLTPYIGNLDPDKYFTNVIDCAKVDAKLYQLPICYKLYGIQTNQDYVGATGTGFTTKEYEKFLRDENALNGKDIITVGQAYYFAKLFNAMSDKFIKNGKVDLSAPEFKILADYVRDNVPEKGRKWNEYSEDMIQTTDPSQKVIDVKWNSHTARLTSCSGLKAYIELIPDVSMGTAFAGMPSADGRGPMIEPNVSVAVSSQALNVDACGEFVKLLMSETIQEKYAMDGKFVLSRDAFRKAGAAAVEYYNGDGGYEFFGFDDVRFVPVAEDKRYMLSDKNIDDVEKIISSCSIMNNVDPAIDIILIEEMPPYFLGQKDLDSVVKIAQDRAQKVLDERRG
ncbi:MAG: extracellular solute-binding protein [Clostridiales bacterium]|nr:extracellular solute-binding protein [Clostridiales bacterium]